MTIRILLADDHQMFLRTLKIALEQESDLEVVAEAKDGSEVLDLIRKTNPDIACLDISMPKMDGLEATRRIVAEFPKIKVIGLSAFDDQYYVLEMISAGASGYVTKYDPIEEIVRAIRTSAHCTKKYLSPNVTSDVLDCLKNPKSKTNESLLSRRERQVVQLIAEGKTSGVIAESLHLAMGTVEVHRRNIMRKLNVHNVADLTKYAIREKIIFF